MGAMMQSEVWECRPQKVFSRRKAFIEAVHQPRQRAFSNYTYGRSKSSESGGLVNRPLFASRLVCALQT